MAYQQVECGAEGAATAASLTAEQRIAEELHELESLASMMLSLRNQIREKSKGLYTGAQVENYQASKAELVAAPLRREVVDLKEHVHTCEQEIIRLTKELEAERRQHVEDIAGDHRNITAQRQRIKELEEDNLRYRKAHVCTRDCRPEKHVYKIGRDLVDQLEAELETTRGKLAELEELHRTMAPAPTECMTVGKLKRQLDTALSQVSALQQRNTTFVADQEYTRKALRSARDAQERNEARARHAEAEVERLDALLVSREIDLATLREKLADTDVRVSSLTNELDRANNYGKAMAQDRDAQQEAKRRAWERLGTINGTINRILSTHAIVDALKPGNDPADYATHLAEALMDIRSLVKDI